MREDVPLSGIKAMKKSRIILIAIFVVAMAAVLYFAYGVIKKRYFPAVNNAGSENDQTQDQTGAETEDQAADQIIENQESVSSGIDSVAPAEGRPDVQKSDCDNNCVNFKNNPDNLKYCQEACGDRPVAPKNSESQCESLSGLEKDSCWRDLAVSKKDFSFCDKISDAKLKKVCVNRVTEEMLD
jgi:hypothetical protein